MKRLPQTEEQFRDPMAERIWQDVVYSMHLYPHDSASSKFFLPEPLVLEARTMAASFALLHYAPIPDMNEIYASRLYGIFFLSIVFGIQIFLHERAIQTLHAPYRIQSNEKEMRHIKNNVIKKLAEGVKVYAPVNQVMDIFLEHLLTPQRRQVLAMKDREFDREKFEKFMPVTVLWGYLFAKEMVEDIA